MLGLETIRTTGKVAKPLRFERGRDLTREDVDEVNQGERVPGDNSIDRLRSRHFGLARAVAAGMSVTEAALVVGYSPIRAHILMADPTFLDLVTVLRKGADVVAAGFHERLLHMGETAAEIMLERLEENPSEVADEMLEKLVKTAADRTGFGPKTTQDVNVNLNLADRLKAARERMIDVTPSNGVTCALPDSSSGVASPGPAPAQEPRRGLGQPMPRAEGDE